MKHSFLTLLIDVRSKTEAVSENVSVGVLLSCTNTVCYVSRHGSASVLEERGLVFIGRFSCDDAAC